jgi:peptidyl-prolyl cis-trans isomerase A (cyclophilin A)
VSRSSANNRAAAGRIFAVALIGIGSLAIAAQPLTKPALFTERAPDAFRAMFDTTKGPFVIEVHRQWAPRGADRFYNLVKNGFYDDSRFFRVLDHVMAQVGMSASSEIQAAWDKALIKDDPLRGSNKRGFVSFATAGPDTRSTQFFINLRDNPAFDRQNSVPFGEVTSRMDVVDALYSGYGDGAPRGQGPDQSLIRARGNAYLTREFPKLDYVKKVTVER